MRILTFMAAGILFLFAGCKKNNTSNPPPPEEKALGPFNIYGAQLCKEMAFVMVNHTGKKRLEAVVENNAANASPEFYLKKTNNGYIVSTFQRIGNDSTFWVWAESPDAYECPPCKSGSGVDIKLEIFKRLTDVSGNKYIFRFNPDGNNTTIQTPAGKYIFSGDGIERDTEKCNRFIGPLISGDNPADYSKMLSEGEKKFDYNFSAIWFFKKKN